MTQFEHCKYLLGLKLSVGLSSVADQKIFEKEEDDLSPLSSFIANAHDEIYAFYTENSGFLKKTI